MEDVGITILRGENNERDCANDFSAVATDIFLENMALFDNFDFIVEFVLGNLPDFGQSAAAVRTGIQFMWYDFGDFLAVLPHTVSCSGL